MSEEYQSNQQQAAATTATLLSLADYQNSMTPQFQASQDREKKQRRKKLAAQKSERKHKQQGSQKNTPVKQSPKAPLQPSQRGLSHRRFLG